MCVIFLQNKVLKMIIIITLSTSFCFKIVMYFLVRQNVYFGCCNEDLWYSLINFYYYYMKYTTVQ